MAPSNDPRDSNDSRETSERQFLSSAVRLATDNAAVGQLPFGALVVRDGEVIGTGVNTALSDFDPTAHAEVAAVRNACLKLGVLQLTGATVVSSCEPCAVCHAVSAAVGITRIVYAAPKEFVPDLGGPVRWDYERLMTDMQQALRALAPDQVVYIPIEGADEPFARFLAYLARGS
jgi:guanine deaminase